MNLPQLNNLIHYVTLMCYANFLCFIYQIHIILVIVLMTIQVFYISIILYKLLLMFMIHVLFINIALSLFTCFMLAYSKKNGYGKELYVPEGTIIVQGYFYLCFIV